MNVLKENELKTFEYIARMTQSELLEYLQIVLRQKYDNVVATKNYIYAEGTIPIALLAHTDTVFSSPPKEIIYDRRQNIMISPQGLGADDRAGIYLILRLIREGYKPHVIFSTDEEKGCVGAHELAQLPCPFKDLRYMVQLDRRGANDCVFYDCDNKTFTEYISSFGFVEAIGSFTDISEYGPAWGVAAVNLSVGYRDEHSYSEVLFVEQMLNTLTKVRTMLRMNENDIPKFEYIPNAYSWRHWYNAAWSTPFCEQDLTHCNCCHKKIPYGKGRVVYSDVNLDYVAYCDECKSTATRKCKICGEYYEPYEGDLSGICVDCMIDHTGK